MTFSNTAVQPSCSGYWVPCHLSVPSMICSNFFRPSNKICYLYLPNVNYLTERPCYPAQDYSEAATVHGVSYICQRDQSSFHRILWLVIFSMGVPKIVMMRRRIKIPICCILFAYLPTEFPLSDQLKNIKIHCKMQDVEILDCT